MALPGTHEITSGGVGGAPELDSSGAMAEDEEEVEGEEGNDAWGLHVIECERGSTMGILDHTKSVQLYIRLYVDPTSLIRRIWHG